MKTHGIEIAPMKPSWLDAVADIHYKSLPDDFLPSLGIAFLKCVYYPAVLRSPNGTTLVALYEKTPCGFVTVAHNSRAFTHDVLHGRYLILAWYAFRSALKNIRQIIRSLEVFHAAIVSKPDPVRGEIVFIAVEEKHRGRGIGKKLVAAALDYLYENKVPLCRTKTLGRNTGVIKMYENMGWNMRERFRLMGKEYVTLVSRDISEVKAEKDGELNNKNLSLSSGKSE